MNRKQRHFHRRAFTLLELMIVLVILVLLFAMVGPRLLGSQRKADIKATKTQIGNLEAALELYAVDMRTFPSSEQGLSALIAPPSDERAARKWDGPYLDDQVVPSDPWDQQYGYQYPPSNNARDFPDIWSAGPDGESGTGDDIGNWRAGSGEGGQESGLDQQGMDQGMGPDGGMGGPGGGMGGPGGGMGGPGQGGGMGGPGGGMGGPRWRRHGPRRRCRPGWRYGRPWRRRYGRPRWRCRPGWRHGRPHGWRVLNHVSRTPHQRA